MVSRDPSFQEMANAVKESVFDTHDNGLGSTFMILNHEGPFLPKHSSYPQ